MIVFSGKVCWGQVGFRKGWWETFLFAGYTLLVCLHMMLDQHQGTRDCPELQAGHINSKISTWALLRATQTENTWKIRNFVYVRTWRPDSYKPGFSSVPSSLSVVGEHPVGCWNLHLGHLFHINLVVKIDALTLSCPVTPWAINSPLMWCGP